MKLRPEVFSVSDARVARSNTSMSFVLVLLMALFVASCSDTSRIAAPAVVGPSSSGLEVPCEEYPNDPACNPAIDYGAHVDENAAPCDFFEACTFFVVKGNPSYSYFLNEIDRMKRHSNFECQYIGRKAEEWWSLDRIYGFNEQITRWDPIEQKWGFLGGDVHHPGQTGWPWDYYRMHVHIGTRSQAAVLETFRHEAAHAAGYTDEREARAMAKKCA